MRKIVTVMTFVTNANGVGPGHSAVAVDDIVYSFESTKGWFNKAGGWLVLDYDDYMKHNESRPVILQTLNAKVDGEKTEAKILQQLGQNVDYAVNGVCSDLANSAVNAGSALDLRMKWPVTPWKVYKQMRNKGLVDAENIIWLDQGGPVTRWASIIEKLKHDYPEVFKTLQIDR